MKKFENYKSNLSVLSTAGEKDLSDEFIVSGIIDKFFIQFELAWKVLKDLMRYEGVSAAATGSPRAILKAAYQIFDFMDEEVWMEMLRERNNLAHIYDGEAAKQLVDSVLHRYIPEFEKMERAIDENYGDALGTL